MAKSLRDWRVGDSVRNNDHHQQAVEAIRELQRMKTLFPDQSPWNIIFIGKIVDTGPNDQADYADCRYWVELQYILGGASGKGTEVARFKADTSQQVPTDSESGQNFKVPNRFTVTNISEWADDSGTHAIPVSPDRIVLVFGFYDAGNPDNLIRYVMSEGAVSDLGNVVVRFDTIISSQWGKYNGTIFSGPPDAVTGAALAMPEGLTSGDACVIYYGDDAITHKAKLGVFAEGRFLGNDPDTGTAIIFVNMTKGRNYGDGPNDSAIDFNNALNYEWIRDAQPDGSFGFGDGALELGVVVGGSYDSGTKQLRLWVERLRIDADGRLEKALSPDGDIDQYIDLSGLLP